MAAILTPERPGSEAVYRQTVRDIAGVFFIKKRIFALTLLGVIAAHWY